MTDIDGPSSPKHDQAEPALPTVMTTDPVIRTALLARRIRALATELRDIPGPKRNLIIKMWSRGDSPAEISRAAVLPLARIQRILGLNVIQPELLSRGGGSSDVAR
jgi:hypothetical protein